MLVLKGSWYIISKTLFELVSGIKCPQHPILFIEATNYWRTEVDLGCGVVTFVPLSTLAATRLTAAPHEKK